VKIPFQHWFLDRSKREEGHFASTCVSFVQTQFIRGVNCWEERPTLRMACAPGSHCSIEVDEVTCVHSERLLFQLTRINDASPVLAAKHWMLVAPTSANTKELARGPDGSKLTTPCGRTKVCMCTPSSKPHSFVTPSIPEARMFETHC
jgi:hypothetical protein